ncbi:glycosyltransferase involved in cell wall biosynthesis [Elusimicrobium posterum]|uniref:glycosyltransferase family 2 protein n=1 Tax=Elusimicrobium posterum TaxID=3116653 RepID=UPI003C71490F
MKETNNSTKLLSIVIPTFNRSENLRVTLENLTNQIKTYGYTDNVEIVVSDNCSTDKSADVVKQFQETLPGTIVYNKNPENIVWENIKKAADLATGKFVWFCGDDDEYFFNALQKVIKTLKENEIDAMYLNQVNPRGYITPVEKDCTVNLKQFFEITNQDSEFISTVIIKKELISPDITIFTWYHMACLLNMPQDSKFYITKEPYMYNRQNAKSWSTISKNLINYTFDAIDTIALSSADSETKHRLIRSYNKNLRKRIIFARLKSDLDEEFYKTSLTRLHEISKHTDFDLKRNIKYLNSKFYCWFNYIIRYRKIYKKPLGKELIYIDVV